MTRFILHGGYTREKVQSNRDFFKEMIKGFDNPKILLIYFARLEEERKELFEDDKNNFGKGTFTVATSNDFENQIKDNDIIYLRGGDTFKLLGELKKINFKKLISGKIVGGSSAGVYALAKYFYNENWDNKVVNGLGILNIKAMCHYSKERDEQLEFLKNFKENIKVVVLKDYEFIVMEEET